MDYPVYSLVGGKWTSFRALSEEITDKALERLRIPRVMSTSNLAIGGGSDYPINSQEEKTWVDLIAEDSGLEREGQGIISEVWHESKRCCELHFRC